MSAHTFEATFAHRLTCTITFDPAVDYDRALDYARVSKQWRPQPTEAEFAAFFADYCRWIHTVNSQISKIIDHPYRTVLHDHRSAHPHWEAWIYHPDGTSECVAQGSGIFKPPAE
jgi:hypothetical protein